MLAKINVNNITLEVNIDTINSIPVESYGAPLKDEDIDFESEILIDLDEAIKLMTEFNTERNADWTYNDGVEVFITYLGNAEQGVNPFEIWSDYEGSYNILNMIPADRITVIPDDNEDIED